MAVAWDASVTSTTDTGSVLTCTNSTLTVGSGSNRALIAFFAGVSAPSGVTIVWDAAGANQALTLIKADNLNTLFTYGLLNPVSGNKILTATWASPSQESHLAAASFTGVNQTSVAVAFPNGNSVFNPTTGTSGTLTITSAIGNMVVAVCSQAAANFTATSGTTISLDGTAGGAFSIGSLYGSGASSVVCTAAWGGGSTNYTMVGNDILASVAAGSPLASIAAQRKIFLPPKRKFYQ